MARNRETKIELTAYDDLFQTDESRAEAALSKIRDSPSVTLALTIAKVCGVTVEEVFYLQEETENEK